MTWEYSEDNLIEQTAMELFHEQLGWDIAIAYNKETFGEGSTLGRLNKKEVILTPLFMEHLEKFNPNLPKQAYKNAFEKLTEVSITKLDILDQTLPPFPMKFCHSFRHTLPLF
jgi:type I restriction enzyme R subunit